MGNARKTKSESQFVGPVYVNIRNRRSLIGGIHQFFAFLAYPTKKDHSFRARFLSDLYAEMYKKHTEDGGDQAGRIPRAYLKRTKRQVRGGWNLGFNRIGSRRLLAGAVAGPIFAGGRIVPQVDPPTGGVIGMVREKPRSVNEALRELWLQKEQHKYGRHNTDKEWQDDQFQNFKRLVWYESLPVLHLAITLCKQLQAYKPNLPISMRGYLLLKDLSWVRDALEYADTWVLPELHKSIPEFDLTKAVRIIPVEIVSNFTFDPPKRY